ncbi:TetR/AcrR family transcriptional regulator [Streptomyces sp. NPDC005498]|uniref:TetR/AcrR family transcriptional regulator n=1 Tax=Streptomyces sp. NPDC005498 TaxID=3364717 RepID=UPI0036CA9569
MTADEPVHRRDIEPTRPRRTDAARNRDALVAAARDEFRLHGADAPLKAVARRTGVGIVTLYRHFPTRTSLIEAACGDDIAATVDTLCRPVGRGAEGTAGRCAEGDWQALVSWLDRFGHAVADDIVLSEVFSRDSHGLAPCRRALGDTVSALLRRAGETSVADERETDALLRTVVTLAVSPLLTRPQRFQAIAVFLDGVQRRTHPPFAVGHSRSGGAKTEEYG